MINLTSKIEQWAVERNLHTAEPHKQAIKLGEEFGELCSGLAKDNIDVVRDSLGDMYVVMTILAMQLDMDIMRCIEEAYEEIKDRKGKLVNGTFIKEDDLPK